MKTLKLTEEIKKEWIKALRSGKYKQGRGQLKKQAGTKGETFVYCCLGVLEAITNLVYDGSYLLAHNRRSCVIGLPRTVQGKLAMYNDESGKDARDFAWIANFIENGFKNPES